MDPVGELFQPGNDCVIIEKKIAKGRRAVAGDDGGSADAGEADTAFGLFLVIEPITIFRHAIFRVCRLMACAHQTISNGEMFELEWL